MVLKKSLDKSGEKDHCSIRLILSTQHQGSSPNAGSQCTPSVGIPSQATTEISQTRRTFSAWTRLLNQTRARHVIPQAVPGEPPELGLEEALGLLRRERVPHHDLPRGRRQHRLLRGRGRRRHRLRVHLPLRPHAPARHHRGGPRPNSGETNPGGPAGAREGRGGRSTPRSRSRPGGRRRDRECREGEGTRPEP